MLFLLRHCLESGEQEVVEFDAAGDVGALVGAVRALESRSEADHIHVRILAAEEAAFQASVDSHDSGFLLVEFFVGLLHSFEERALHVGFPTRISAAEFAGATGEFSQAYQAFGESFLGCVDRGAEESLDGEVFASGFDDGEVERSLDEAFHIAAHADNAVGSDHHGVDNLLGVGVGDDILRHAYLFVFHEEVRFDGSEFLFDPRSHLVEFSEDALGVFFRESDDRFAVARNSVAHVAAIDADKTEATFSHPAKMAEEKLVDIGTAGVDLHTGVATLESAEGELVGDIVLGGFLGGVGYRHGGVDAASATNIELALGLGVEIEKELALKFAGLETESTGHTCFLVGGDESLEGTVFDGLGLEDSHDGGNAKAVVGAEGGIASVYPITNDFGLDRIFQEVVLFASAGLRHHIHVGLKDNRATFLHSLGGGFGHDNVSNLVDTAVDFFAFCPLDEEVADSLFML